MSSSTVVPVVIVGAGLGGSAAAAFLGRAGVPAHLLERREQPTSRPRAWILSARTMELLRGLALDEQVRTLGTPGSWDLQVVDRLVDVLPGPPPVDETLEVSPTGAAQCDQDLVEGVLRDYATGHGATISWSSTVTEVVDHGDVVEVRRDGAPPVLAQYVVVAEGARPGLLPGLGTVSRHQPETFEEFFQVLFRSDELDALMSERPGKAFLCSPSGTIVFRRDLGRWQLQRQGRDFEDPQNDIAAAVGATVEVEVLDHGSWRPGAHLADSFRPTTSGRVFLVGDAAHAMPPSLGMAGNLAIGDAHNLAWKLAWVLDGRAGAGLLDSYEPERRPVDQRLMLECVAVTRGERNLDPLVVDLGLGYPAGSSPALVGEGDSLLITDPHDRRPTVGARLPHEWLTDGRSTLDLADVDTFVTVGGSPVADPAVPSCTLASYDDEGVWLVRPDGQVAAHVRPDEVRTTLDVILDRLG